MIPGEELTEEQIRTMGIESLWENDRVKTHMCERAINALPKSVPWREAREYCAREWAKRPDRITGATITDATIDDWGRRVAGRIDQSTVELALHSSNALMRLECRRSIAARMNVAARR